MLFFLPENEVKISPTAARLCGNNNDHLGGGNGVIIILCSLQIVWPLALFLPTTDRVRGCSLTHGRNTDSSPFLTPSNIVLAGVGMD